MITRPLLADFPVRVTRVLVRDVGRPVVILVERLGIGRLSSEDGPIGVERRAGLGFRLIGGSRCWATLVIVRSEEFRLARFWGRLLVVPRGGLFLVLVRLNGR